MNRAEKKAAFSHVVDVCERMIYSQKEVNKRGDTCVRVLLSSYSTAHPVGLLFQDGSWYCGIDLDNTEGIVRCGHTAWVQISHMGTQLGLFTEEEAREVDIRRAASERQRFRADRLSRLKRTAEEQGYCLVKANPK